MPQNKNISTGAFITSVAFISVAIAVSPASFGWFVALSGLGTISYFIYQIFE